ncbi:MAG: pyruvate kinase [Halobacteriales archaeon SW_9_67_25]|nr:MAG: pyruvate kinase [Halobacteriales archaeon SW_9_67_25]
MQDRGCGAVSRRAKIVCTLGPASEDRATIAGLAEAGMSVARLNASHGNREQRRSLIETLRDVDGETEEPLAVMHDLPGPEVRTADTDTPVVLEAGDTVEFAPGTHVDARRVGLSRSIEGAGPGDAVLLDDGRLEATVTGVDGEVVTGTIEVGGKLGSRAGVNVPGVDLELPAVTDTDRAELDLAAEMGVDFVAASFVRDGGDIFEIDTELQDRGADIPVIAKIERADAVANLADIVDAADGVMVARGDLGVECPLEDIPIIQKRIIRTCHRAGVPVITATEMLDSMIHQRRPTRAETSDVANAILDGTDAVMLSGETAVGDHPQTVVETMDRIIRYIEASDEYSEVLERRVPAADDTRTDALARSARFLARDVDATAVVAASESGYTARKAAKYRPHIPVVAATTSERVRRELALTWGITAQRVGRYDSADAIIQNAVQSAIDTGVAESGDTVVVLSGMMTELEGLDTANMLKVHVAAERLTAGRSVVDGHVTGPLYRIGDGDLSGLPDGVVLYVPSTFEGEFDGDIDTVAGIVDAHQGVTGYPALVARELDVPMVCDAHIEDAVADGTEVSLDGERGVVYADPSVEEP